VTNRIPANWEPADLVSVAVVTSGQSPPGSTYNTIGEGLPFFQGKAEFGDVSPTPVKWCSAPLRIAHPGDVLISVRAPVGPTNLADVECCIGRGLAAITPLGGMPSKFYLYYLRHSVEDLVRQATGTTFQAISGKQLRAHEVLVPPLPEQHRIVEAIESYLTRLDDAVASLDRVQQNLKRYRASVLKAAVEGHLVPTEAELARKEGRSYEPASELLKRILVERRKKWIENAGEKARAKTEEKARKVGQSWTHNDNVKTLEKERAKAAKRYKEPTTPDTTNLPNLPKGWCWATVDQLASQVVDCLHSTPTFVSRGRACLDTNSMSSDGVVLERLRFVDEETFLDRNRRMQPLKGDVVFAREGTVGTAICLRDDPRVCLGQRVMIIRPGSALSGEYLANSLMSTVIKRQYEANIAGSTVAHINMADIRRFAIPVPPLQEQQRIVADLARVATLIRSSSQSSVRGSRVCHHLRQSILKWAFEGKLVPQDPEDEPASALLDRIKAECSASRRHR